MYATNPQKPRVRASLFHSFMVNYLSEHLTGRALQRSRGWSIHPHSLTSLWWLFFACQIPLQRKRAPAKQARRCQLSSCQGNERETWRKGQTPTYSKRSAMLLVRQNKHTHFLFVLRWHLLTSPHNTHSSYYTVTMRPFNFYRQSLDFQMDDDLSRYAWLLGFVHTVLWENTGKEHFRCFDPFICRSEGEDQQVKMKCFRWFNIYIFFLQQFSLPSVSWIVLINRQIWNKVIQNNNKKAVSSLMKRFLQIIIPPPKTTYSRYKAVALTVRPLTLPAGSLTARSRSGGGIKWTISLTSWLPWSPPASPWLENLTNSLCYERPCHTWKPSKVTVDPPVHSECW